MTHVLTLLEAIELTPDTRHFVFTRPEGYTFEMGQAADLALDREGWRDETRPFTFTGDPEADVLCFVIKSYPDHEGVTAQMWSMRPGARVHIGEPRGAITDRGPGVFIAGGAGITPYIGMLRAHAQAGMLDQSTLIFANRTPRDIILRPLWDSFEDLKTVYVVAEADSGFDYGRITGEMLDAKVTDWSQTFYVCGPPDMEDDVVDLLRAREVPDDRIVRDW